MKAILLTEKHQPVQFVDVPKPVAQAGEVLVRLQAAALNHRDVFIQQGLYPRIKLPVVLGSDGAGVVEAVGDGVDSGWVGQSVLLNPAINWGNNPAFDGPDFQILGMPRNGTFAEYVTIGIKNVHPKPVHLSFEQSAALPLTGLTAWRALTTRARLDTNGATSDKVLITGIGGGVALIALQLAVAAGAEVWVTSGSDEKLAKAQTLGAVGGVNYHEQDWHRTLIAKTKIQNPARGYFDIIIDSAGGPGFSKLIDLASPGGRIVFFGGTTGAITDIIPAKIFFKQLSILGTTMGNEQEFDGMLSFINEKKITPVLDDSFALENAQQAFDKMNSGRQFGKIILEIG